MKKGKIGCGQSLNFEILPRLHNIEQILTELYDVHTIDEAIQRFNADEEIQKTRKEVERQINNKFRYFQY